MQNSNIINNKIIYALSNVSKQLMNNSSALTSVDSSNLFSPVNDESFRKNNAIDFVTSNNTISNSDGNLKSSNSSKVNFDDSEFIIKKNVSFLVKLISSEDLIDGEISKTQLFLENLYEKNKLIYKECFQKTWLELFKKDSDILRDFICAAANLDYSSLEDKADAIVLGACAHNDIYVNEAGIRAIEAWSQPSHLSFLEQMRDFDVDWLQEYKIAVCEYLKRIV